MDKNSDNNSDKNPGLPPGFKKFTKKSQRLYLEPRISISHLGVISFNKGVLDKHLQDNQKYCHLFFDETLRTIGIRPIIKKQRDSFKLYRNKENNYAMLTANSFLKAFDLVPKKTATYRVGWDKKNEIILVDLKQSYTTKASNESDLKQGELFKSRDPDNLKIETLIVEGESEEKRKEGEGWKDEDEERKEEEGELAEEETE